MKECEALHDIRQVLKKHEFPSSELYFSVMCLRLTLIIHNETIVPKVSLSN